MPVNVPGHGHGWAENDVFYPIIDPLSVKVVALVLGKQHAEAVCRLFDFEGHAKIAGVSPFIKEMINELQEVRAVHVPIHSIEEGYSVLLEEVDEVWEEIRRKPGERRPDYLARELIQVATVAWRIAQDLRYVES